MTHRERLLTVLRGDVPDQVPVTWELVGRFARELTGEQRCLDAAMAGGGYVMTTSDEVPADAKLDNMRAVVDYVAEHGRY